MKRRGCAPARGAEPRPPRPLPQIARNRRDWVSPLYEISHGLFRLSGLIVRCSRLLMQEVKRSLTRKQRNLGAAGPMTSAIGLGCMGMSGAYGPADRDEAIATIHA